MSQIIMMQDVIDRKVTVAEASKMGIMHQGEMFSYFDEGCTRFVFSNEDRTKVIKLEKEGRGTFNQIEIDIYKNASDEDLAHMAETKMINGFIEQEFVMPIKFGGKRLTMEQIRFSRSCRSEVGWTKDDRLLCFDLDEYKKY
jgi:hypothetical protein